MEREALQQLSERIVRAVRRHRSVVVALSGGVDSAVVAALAHRALGDNALAVTAAAETLAGRELQAARQVAQQIGIRHQVVTHSELDNPEFVKNPKYRCYVCQGMRMDLMRAVANEAGLRVVLDGTNASDPGPDRPGLRAIHERGVRSPLLEQEVDKQTTRELARWLKLEVWDRPSNACLSSRIPHGQIVTLGKLRRVEAAEEVLHRRGYRQVRVRHDGARARVEIGAVDLQRARSEWEQLRGALEECGFPQVELDPAGYRSGGANRVASRSEEQKHHDSEPTGASSNAGS